MHYYSGVVMEMDENQNLQDWWPQLIVSVPSLENLLSSCAFIVLAFGTCTSKQCCQPYQNARVSGLN